MALRDAIRPSDMELMDIELRSFLATPDNDVAVAIQELAERVARRSPGRAGRDDGAGDSAARRRRRTGPRRPHGARDPARRTRRAPGAHRRGVGLDGPARPIARRQRIRGRSPDPRRAARRPDRGRPVPASCDQPTPVERARAISNVLWPWGESTRSVASYNPYAPVLAAAVDVVRDHWSPPVTVWTSRPGTTRNGAGARRTGARSRGDRARPQHASARSCAQAILDLNTVPVEVGPLMFHPQVTAVSDAGEHVEARVLLREAWL